MKVVVASCMAYRDAWGPFTALFQKFWPDCPYEVHFATDKENPGQSWGSVVSQFAALHSEPLLLMQEDMFINSPVNAGLVELALTRFKVWQPGMLRLYPCPGATHDYGDAFIGSIEKGTPYRVSCQASIWDPAVLHTIASQCETAADFEIQGSRISDAMAAPFFAWKREVKPWPLEYFCSAISRGKWEPAALEFCRQHCIDVDTSFRGIAA